MKALLLLSCAASTRSPPPNNSFGYSNQSFNHTIHAGQMQVSCPGSQCVSTCWSRKSTNPCSQCQCGGVVVAIAVLQLLLQLLRLLWLLHMLLLHKAAKHHLIDLSSPLSQRFQLLQNNNKPHWPMCVMLVGWSRQLRFVVHESMTSSRSQVVRLQGNKIFGCSEFRGYTYTLYLCLSMCKYIYICRVDVCISPSVTLQLFAAVLGLTHPACLTSCE